MSAAWGSSSGPRPAFRGWADVVAAKGKELGELAAGEMSSPVARALLVGCAATYGYSYVSTKQLQQTLHPFFVTALRFIFGSVIFVPSMLKQIRHTSAEATFGAMELGALCAIGFISQGISLQTTSASKVAFCSGLSVIMPPLFNAIDALIGRCWRGESKSMQQQPKASRSGEGSTLERVVSSPFVAPLLALVGAAILELGSYDAPHIRDLALLITPASFSLCFWKAERLSRRAPSATELITGVMLATCAVISTGFALVSGSVPLSSVGLADLGSKLFNRASLAALVFQSVLATAATSYVEQRALKILSAGDTTLIYSLEPIFASLFAALFLREHLGVTNLVSALFIISACLYDSLFAAKLKQLFVNKKRA